MLTKIVAVATAVAAAFFAAKTGIVPRPSAIPEAHPMLDPMPAPQHKAASPEGTVAGIAKEDEIWLDLIGWQDQIGGVASLIPSIAAVPLAVLFAVFVVVAAVFGCLRSLTKQLQHEAVVSSEEVLPTHRYLEWWQQPQVTPTVVSTEPSPEELLLATPIALSTTLTTEPLATQPSPEELVLHSTATVVPPLTELAGSVVGLLPEKQIVTSPPRDPLVASASTLNQIETSDGADATLLQQSTPRHDATMQPPTSVILGTPVRHTTPSVLMASPSGVSGMSPGKRVRYRTPGGGASTPGTVRETSLGSICIDLVDGTRVSMPSGLAHHVLEDE